LTCTDECCGDDKLVVARVAEVGTSSIAILTAISTLCATHHKRHADITRSGYIPKQVTIPIKCQQNTYFVAPPPNRSLGSGLIGSAPFRLNPFHLLAKIIEP